MAENARRHLESGQYDSMSEVIQAGLEALDREEAAFDEYLRVKVAEALADPRPPIPLKEAMAQIRAATRRVPE